MKTSALMVVGFLGGCVEPTLVEPSFQPGTPNEDVQVTALNVPIGAARGDTVAIVFTVLNADHRGHVLDVQVSLDSIVAFTNGASCGEGNACAFTLDIVELNLQRDPRCEFLNPGASGQVSEPFAAGESRSYVWRWQVAKLSCIPPEFEPVAGEYWLTAYARYVRPNGVVVPGWRRMRFTVREAQVSSAARWHH